MTKQTIPTELLTTMEVIEDSSKNLIIESTELLVNTIKLANNITKGILIEQEISLELKNENRSISKEIESLKNELRLKALKESLNAKVN